ncbi:GxxExxY protein [[Hallella] seregens]|uniref:GxxExxY protein n=1 Tax=Hallella seregens ATCC 51272 TaxID=1336250 RepID=A0ABV5ZLK4_9BACT|nr:GxxExxY protein [Hallella seregens]
MEEKISSEYTHRLLACAYAVHTALGPGLLESIYEKALAYELELNGFHVETQVPVKVMYRGLELDHELKLDMLVDRQVVIEIKSLLEVKPVHYKQLLTYLRLLDVRLGYLINFDVPLLKDGIQRVVNNY